MRGSSSGYAHGTSGSPQTTLEQNEYAAKVAENEAALLDAALAAKPTFTHVSINAKGKLEGYALNPDHPTGKNKARVFKSALGFTQADAAELERQIREKAPYHEAIKGRRDKYGQRWTVRIPIEGNNGRTATVETGWIVRPDKLEPELTTAFVMKERKNA